MEPPTREKTGTDKDTRRRSYDNDDFSEMEDDKEYPDLEYLIDSQESREMDDPYHILLLGSTFEKAKITVPYVAGSLEYVLNMPMDEGKVCKILSSRVSAIDIHVVYNALMINSQNNLPSCIWLFQELSAFAKEHGMSCLGTWPREECLSLGKQLQVRDIVCRVVPFCEGGQRGWQAKDVSSSSNSNNADSFRWMTACTIQFPPQIYTTTNFLLESDPKY